MRILLSLFILASLSGCSFFTEREVKKTAEIFLTQEYENIYRAEMKTAVGDNHHRSEDFIGYLLRHTSIAVDSVTKESEDIYKVELSVKAPIAEVRTYILEQMKPLVEEHAANSFNFGDSVITFQRRYDRPEVEPSHKTMVTVRKINEAWVAK